MNKKICRLGLFTACNLKHKKHIQYNNLLTMTDNFDKQ